MALRILHTSDLHGEWKKLLQAKDFDLWVDSGDFFPNITRGAPVEAAFQKAWFTQPRMGLKRKYRAKADFWLPRRMAPPFDSSIAAKVGEWLAGRPMISVPGNHDFVSLGHLLRKAGLYAWDLTDGPFVIEGRVFAGFREVPYLTGEWKGELPFRHMGAAKAHAIVQRTMSANPEVLVTHTPPQGILDYSGPKGGRVGLKELAHHLAYKPHSVELHLFGHVHEQPGLKQEMGITFSNAARGGRIIEL